MAENEAPPIPEGLCGIGGCVYIADHESSDLPAGLRCATPGRPDPADAAPPFTDGAVSAGTSCVPEQEAGERLCISGDILPDTESHYRVTVRPLEVES